MIGPKGKQGNNYILKLHTNNLNNTIIFWYVYLYKKFRNTFFMVVGQEGLVLLGLIVLLYFLNYLLQFVDQMWRE